MTRLSSAGGRGGRGRAAGPARATAIGDPAGVVAGAGTVAAGPGVAGAGGGRGGLAGRGCVGARGGAGEKGRPGPGRAKIVIRPIVNDHQRQTTFTKRKKGLRKKVEELAVLCEVEICLICYGASTATGTDKQNNNQNNNLFWGNPSADHVIRRYKAIPKEEQDKKKLDNTSMLELVIKKHAGELRELRERNEKRCDQRGCDQQGYQFEEVLRHCNVAQLWNLMDEVRQKRDLVYARLERIHREQQAGLQIQQPGRASGSACLGQMPFEDGGEQFLQAVLDTARGGAGGDGAVLESTGLDSELASGMHQNYPLMDQGLTFNKLLHMQQEQFFPFSASSSGMLQQRLVPQGYRWENQGVPPRNFMLYHQMQHQQVPRDEQDQQQQILDQNGPEQQSGQFGVNLHQQQQQHHPSQQGEQDQYQNLLSGQHQQQLQQILNQQHLLNQHQQQEQQFHPNQQEAQNALRLNQQQQQLHGKQEQQNPLGMQQQQQQLHAKQEQQNPLRMNQHRQQQQQLLAKQEHQNPLCINQQQLHANQNQEEQLQYQTWQEQLQYQPSLKRGFQEQVQYQLSLMIQKRGRDQKRGRSNTKTV